MTTRAALVTGLHPRRATGTLRADMVNRAVRRGRWKLVWGVTRGAWELYDMESDRTETCDLAQDHPQRVAQVSRAWFEWAQRTEVVTPERDASGDSSPQRCGP